MSTLFVLLIGIISFNSIQDAGSFKKIKPHFDGECIPIFGLNGPEDITFLNNGTALISSDDRWSTLNNISSQGHIYLYDIKNNQSNLINLTSELDFEFHPHGISIFENKDGSTKILAINHTIGGHSIEVFKLINNKLVYLKTIKDKLLVSPNDLVLLNENQFYLTNDHGSGLNTCKIIEDFMQLSNANVLFFDGAKFVKVIDNLSYANGINISRDKNLIYLTETIGKSLKIYIRDFLTNKLTLIEKVNLDSGLDNIEVNNEGDLWIGSHPKMFKFVKHAINSKKKSPSQVFKITLDKENNLISKEIFLDDGEMLSGSSVAAVYNNVVLIGSVFEDHFLKCNINR